MRLFKRGEYWWCSFPWKGENVRKSTRCTTRAAALLVAQRWERERADPFHAAAASATLGGVVTTFLATLDRRDVPAATKAMYRQKCGVLVRLFGAEMPLVELEDPKRVDHFIEQRQAEPVAFDEDGSPTRFVSANTMHKELVALRQVLKHARRRGEFRRDPAEVLPVGFSAKYEPRKTALTMPQAEALLQELGERGRVVAFILATSARRSEAFAARAEDLSVATGVVQLYGSKTTTSNRTVTVQPFALALLEYAKGGVTWGHLFTPWPNMRRALQRACKRVGAPRVTANDLRRTLATWLIEGGASTYAVSKVLGHSSTAMVERVYGRPREDAVADLLARQTRGIRPVRLVYVSPTERERTEPTLSGASSEIPANLVGRPGLEPGTYGLKVRSSTD